MHAGKLQDFRTILQVILQDSIHKNSAKYLFCRVFFESAADEAFPASFLAFSPDFLQPRLVEGLSFSIIHKKFKY